MHDFQITFTHPWLLLLIIPALAVVLIPFFLLSRKYRRNRNRVTSVVLHSCVSLCCVLLLAGMGFSYNVDNSENEILIVMDASYSTDKEKEAKDSHAGVADSAYGNEQNHASMQADGIDAHVK